MTYRPKCSSGYNYITLSFMGFHYCKVRYNKLLLKSSNYDLESSGINTEEDSLHTNVV